MSIPLSKSICRTSLLAATVCGLALISAPANAQQYSRYGEPVSYGTPADEEIEVIAPRHHERSAIGAEIRDVALSQEVRFNDLDLRTAWGARALRARVRYTASNLCMKLDVRYPVSADNSPPCYATALRNAMYEANEAISDARARNY